MSDESEFDSSEVEMELPLAPTESAEAWKLKGDDAYRSKEYSKAIDAYTCAIRSQVSPSANFYTNRSAAYLMIGSYQDALRDCEAGMKIEPNNPKIYLRKVSLQRLISC